MRKLTAKDLLSIFGNSKYSVKCDKFDVQDFNEIKACSRDLLKTEKAGTAEAETFPELMQDMYSLLFKVKPQMAEDHEIKDTHLLNLELMKQLSEHRKVKEIRTVSALDNMVSALGVENLGPEMIELLKQMKEQKQAINDMLEAARQAQEAAEQAGEGEGEGDGGEGEEGEEGDNPNGTGKGGQNMSLEEAKRRLEEARKQVQDSFNDPNFQHSLGQTLGRVKHKVVETSNMIKTWGLGSDASFSKTSYREKMNVMHRLESSSKLKKIAELAGRMSALAMSAQNQKVKRGFEEIYNVELGRDIERMLPQEIAKLADPHRRIEFLMNWSEGRCLQYALKGKEKKARGAIVMCIDESGSMGGESEIWAKAVAIALLHIATKQKRDFHVVHFSGDSNWKRLPTHTFPKEGPLDAVKLIDMAELFINGGTDFEAPLTSARMHIEQQKNYHKADIVFVTDGECAVRNDWLKDFLKWKKEKGVSIYSILINCGYNSDASLREFSNSVYPLNDLTGKNADDIVLDIFTNV